MGIRAEFTLTILMLLPVGMAGQDTKPSAAPTRESPGCIVVKPESGGEQIAGSFFGMGSLFYYIYSNNINGVKSIDKYKSDLSKGQKPSYRVSFNLSTLVVWNWAGTKIIPLRSKYTEAELKDAVAACDAFVARATGQ
jgi:hypothetical protein